MDEHPRRERARERTSFRGGREAHEVDGRRIRVAIGPDSDERNRVSSGPGFHDRQDVCGVACREVPKIQQKARDARREQSQGAREPETAVRGLARLGGGKQGQYGVGAQEPAPGETGGHGASPPRGRQP
ncbi:hypothetical protein GCM10010343_31060 [Streptomyces avidinii]|nr:hypothetical protein GCM10010343_31060 [Streptomyces avidinii]